LSLPYRAVEETPRVFCAQICGMNGLVRSGGDRGHQRDQIGEHQGLEILALGRVLEDRVEPLGAQQVLERGPDHHGRRAPLDETIEYVLG
jgi:hypothetical protein